ncbi:sensor histidine kinase [Margalitia sp. FSL K6-0131]|uniref:sensor histidine kinase n=1 Tax=Margalitia sp. FSL K6-0131 TaxID=2954604 RepID=UPI0030F99DF3
MNMLKNKYFKYNIFHKLLLASSLTLVVTVIILIVTITNYYSDIIIQRERDIDSRTLDRVDGFFSNKQGDVDYLVRELYGRSDLISDVSLALNKGYEDYMKSNLDRYTKSHSFISRNINTIFMDFFNQDPNINAVSLRSIALPEVEYLFIYNNGRWNDSIKDQTANEIPPRQMQPFFEGQSYPKRHLKDTITKEILLYNPGTMEKMGILSIYYSTDGLDQIVKRKNSEVEKSFFLLNKEGKVLYSDNHGIPKKLIEKVSKKTGESIQTYQGQTYYMDVSAQNNEYTYIGVIPKKELNKLTFARGTMWVLIIFATLAAILITYRFTSSYSKRIGQIVASIREVEKGNLSVRIPESKKADELSIIGISFNSMLVKLNDYIERFFLLNNMQKQAELKALQAQINPHFLFNTLEVIRMVAVMEGSDTSGDMIFHLSRMLRYSLETKETVSLQVEIENVEQYLKLIQLQYPNKLQVAIQIPKEMENVPIQRLILQPLVENYIKHGFKKDRNDNKLEIIGQKAEGDIEISIKDNGTGISYDQLTLIRDQINDKDGVEMKSIGLRNVHQRLNLKFNDPYGLSIQSVPDQETIVTVLIPGEV